MNLLYPDGTATKDFATGGGSKPNATEGDLINALTALERGDIEYVGLEDERTKKFMQAAGDGASGYILEYNDGSDDAMLRAPGTLSGTQLTAALSSFFNHDDAWRTMFRWEQFEF